MKSELLDISIRAAIEAGKKILEVYNDPASDFEVERKSDNSPLTIADRLSHKIIAEILSGSGIPILSEEGASIDYSERSTWNNLWIVDPLDGTKEFIKKNGEFTVNIALVTDSVPVLGVIYVPVLGEIYFAQCGLGAFKGVDVGAFEDGEMAVLNLPLEQNREEGECRVVASRSHLNDETICFLDELKKDYPKIEILSKGSSLKICLIAEGVADIYPRYAPTMEWDTAAGDAILRAMGGALENAITGEKLQYNKENLLNPYFIAK
ncbi:MAG: 3'(2'),5'-bisphosphate nucleotidase CysQ [Rikenellaceae bacterium]